MDWSPFGKTACCGTWIALGILSTSISTSARSPGRSNRETFESCSGGGGNFALARSASLNDGAVAATNPALPATLTAAHIAAALAAAESTLTSATAAARLLGHQRIHFRLKLVALRARSREQLLSDLGQLLPVRVGH